MPSYIPSRLDAYEPFVRNLYTKLTDNPTAYGTTEAGIAAFVAAFTEFSTTFAVSQNPVTRTTATIAGRNTARAALNGQVRPLVATLQASPVMTDQKRHELELPIRDYEPTPVPVPHTVPTVTVVSVEGRLLNLKLSDVTVEGRAKPAQVRGAWLYSYVGEEMPSFEMMVFRGEATRTTTQVVMPEDVAAGSKVWLSACWVSTSVKPGAVSLPVATWTTHGAMQNTAA